MKKRILSTILTAGMIAMTLAGCASASPDAASSDETAADATDTASDSAAADTAAEEQVSSPKNIVDTLPLSMFKGKRVVGLVTSEGGLDDESFNQSAWEGLQRVSGQYDCDEIYIETAPGTDFKANLDKMIAQDPDLCWSVGFSSVEAMHDAALENPDISFAIIDNSMDDTPDNMTYVVFRNEEPAFLVGYIAGCVTETGRIGFVGGEENSVIEAFQCGYMGGAALAESRGDKTVDVLVEYTGSFTDDEAGREAAAKLYDEGCDIVFHAAGETGLGVIAEAKDRGLYVIGVDKDQSYLAPDNVLTSAMKYVSVAIYTISGDYLSKKTIGGQTVNLGLAENSVGISSVHNLYPDDIYNEAMDLQEQIIAGTIVPPSDLSEYKEYLSSLD